MKNYSHTMKNHNSFMHWPNEKGYYGSFGGRFVSETLMPPLYDLERAYHDAINDSSFTTHLEHTLRDYGGRPSPLYHAQRTSQYFGGAQLYFKREELNHTGSHKINNVLGQGLLAQRMGKKRIIAETGAGQHGVATATICALLDMECIIYMGARDVERQSANTARMRLLGATVIPVHQGSATLKDAMNEALREWVSQCDDTYYLIGSAAGPHPYPMIVRDFQTVIGKETRTQMHDITGKLPDVIIACVGGGSNAIGMFHPFLDEPDVRLIGVEAAGSGLNTQQHAAAMNRGSPGTFHGSHTYILQNTDGQIIEAESISAGLDYPGVGPEHAYLKEAKRVEYLAATDHEALSALKQCARLEGIIPALEPAHALAKAYTIAKTLPVTTNIVVNLCGRGDKDMSIVMSVDETLTSPHTNGVNNRGDLGV